MCPKCKQPVSCHSNKNPNIASLRSHMSGRKCRAQSEVDAELERARQTRTTLFPVQPTEREAQALVRTHEASLTIEVITPSRYRYRTVAFDGDDR